MKVKIKRIRSNSEETLGELYVNGKFVCYTLEDEKRNQKVYAETRIPAGEYSVKLRQAGSMHPKYAQKFPGVHRGMLHLQNVPGFEWIYIHIGNTDNDTAGCILVGLSFSESGGRIRLTSSRSAYLELYKILVAQLGDGRPVTVSINDEGMIEPPKFIKRHLPEIALSATVLLVGAFYWVLFGRN